LRRCGGPEVEINSGVKQGDQVILNPAVDLAEGSRVRTRPQATQTSRPAPDAASEAVKRRANSKTLFNGGTDLSSLCFCSSGPTALSPGGGVQMAAERTADALSYAPE